MMDRLRNPRSSFSSSMLLALNDVFFFFLGGSAWILINGIYAQVPFIILMFDGDYRVVSKITLCVTISSLVPILLSISFFESSATTSATALHNADKQHWYIDVGIALVLSIGITTSSILTIWTEGVTSHLGPLMATVTAGGIVGTTSSILYYPYAATTPRTLVLEFESKEAKSSIAKRQTTVMLFGTATTNLLVALLAILQQEQVKKQPGGRLEKNIVTKYFATLMILMVLSITGFAGTLMIRRMKEEKVSSDYSKSNVDDNYFNEHSSLIEAQSLNASTSSHHNLPSHQSHPSTPKKSLSFWEMTYLNFTLNAAQFMLNALTFFLPGIVPYSVRGDDEDESNTALQYLIVFQLVAQTLGVFASSRSSKSSGQTTNDTVKCQLRSFFLLLWVPLVFLSLSNQKKFGVMIPIFLNTLLNFAYTYCNTLWFHFSVHRHKEHYRPIGGKDDTVASINKANEPTHLNNAGAAVSTTSAARIMGTWHQIGAMLGSAIAFVIVQSETIVTRR